MTQPNKQLTQFVDQEKMDKLNEINDFCSFYTDFFRTTDKSVNDKVQTKCKTTFNKKERDDVSSDYLNFIFI